jgi:hypothetical protein
MSKRMMQDAARWLGDAVIAFELGNEPGEAVFGGPLLRHNP